jgi:hypothetical protein
VNLSALRAGCSLPPGRFLVLISVRGWVDPSARVRLEGLGQLEKNPPHRDSNPRSSGLQHSASTNYATACPSEYMNFFVLAVKCVVKTRGQFWRNVYTVLYRKPNHHWRPKCTWEDNIKMDLKEIGSVDSQVSVWCPVSVIEILFDWRWQTISFSTRTLFHRVF